MNVIALNETGDNVLSKRNRVLLTVMWLRIYPTYCMLSSMFGISVTCVKSELQRFITLFDNALSTYIQWPSIQDWQMMQGHWPRISIAVGDIDGTSHQIYRPLNNQQQFYSGHRSYHCLHTQVVVDNNGNIRYVESGFFGHQNDAQTIRLMFQIGNVPLTFPDNCVFLADKIYPNGHPVLPLIVQPNCAGNRAMIGEIVHALTYTTDAIEYMWNMQ